jgi:CSLREA domain-containing protein
MKRLHQLHLTSLVALGLSTNASASIILVDTTDSTVTADSHCSLREALQAAETGLAVDTCAAGQAGGTDEIFFARTLSGQTISLSSDLLLAAGSVVVDGLGRKIIISASSSDDPFQILGGDVTLRGLDIRAAGSGSGFVLYGTNTQLTLEGCYVIGRLGMNAFGSPSTVRVYNSTLVSTESSAVSDIGIRSGGSNTLEIANSTVVAGTGVGVDASSSSGTTTIYSSIVVGATTTAGTVTTTFSTLATTRAGAGLDTAPADNGGPTRTLALLSGSAIDGGDCAAAPLPNFDQRYYVNNATQKRLVGAKCDAGAYESGAVTSTDSLFADAFELY